MGKTSAPLSYVTTQGFRDEHYQEFKDLQDKGHHVMLLTDPGLNDHTFDIILDPRAWRTWTDPVTGRIANLDMATKAARVAKKLREKHAKK